MKLVVCLLMALIPRFDAPAQPIACNLAALNHTERDRLSALLDKLTTGAVHRQELRDGYAYEIVPAKVSFREVAEWVSLESRCCPFLNFRIDLAGRAVRLQLTGGSGVKQFIQAEMHRLPK
jgi:hypothetical protein